MRVRLAYSGARKRMNEICDECWLKYYPAYMPRKKVEEFVAAKQRNPRKTVKNTRGTWSIIVEDKGIKGFAVCSTKKGEGHLIAMYVDPNKTSKGYGAALMERVLEDFKTRKLKSAHTEAQVKNKGAIKFYERYGFRKKRVINYEVNGVKFREWLMVREL